MKTTAKKVLHVLLQSLVFVLLAVGFVACNEESKRPSGSQSGTESTLTLSQTSIEMTVWQSKTIYVDYNGAETVVWSVSGEDLVVSVTDGVINALKTGEAVVTATAGEQKAECKVKVNAPDEGLFALEIVEANPVSYVGEDTIVEAALLYDGAPLSGVDYAYESYNAEVAEVSASGVISAKTLGEATVLVSATVSGFEFNAAVNLSVVPVGKVGLERNKIEIYALASVGGQTFENSSQIEAKAYEREEEVREAILTYEAEDSAQDIFTVDGTGLITAVNAGTATLVLSYKGSDGQTVTDEVTIVVKPVEIVASAEPLLIDLSEGAYAIDTKAVFGEALSFTQATVSDELLSTAIGFEGNSLDFSNISAGEKTLSLSTRNVIYSVGADIWSMLIETKEDLTALQTATNGRYRLENDLSMRGVEWKYADETVKFSGTFDGQNHTLEGLTLNGANGLFAVLSGNATVKNLKLSDCVLTATAKTTGSLAATLEGYAGATAKIDNVTLSVIDKGVENGGLIGGVRSGATLSVNALNIRHYEALRSQNSGAVFGKCLGTVTFTKTEVISASLLCGTKADADNSVATAESLNALEISVKPVALDSLNAATVSDDGTELELDAAVGSVSKILVYGNDLREETVSGRNYTLTRSDVRGLQGGAVEVWFENAGGEEFFYEIPLTAKWTMTQANATDLLLATVDEIELGGNIDLSGIEWKPTKTFTGTLDGKGYSISDLSLGNSTGATVDGLFKVIDGATIKNLYLKDVKLKNFSGALAYQYAGAPVIENVVVSAASVTERSGGIVNRATNLTDKLTLKDVLVVFPSSGAQKLGFVGGFQTRSVSLENCHFVGGNGLLVAADGALVVGEGSTYTVYSNTFDLYTAINEETASLTELAKKAVTDALALTEINKENISLLQTATTGYYMLTENIDMTGVAWSPSGTFSGILDGNGHTISNFAPNGAFGLFNTFAGTVKNLAIKDFKGTRSKGFGFIAYQPSGTVTIENVFITSTVDPADNEGGLFRQLNSGAIVMKNVIMVVPATTKTVYGFATSMVQSGKSVTVENCHLIGANGKLCGLRTSGSGWGEASVTGTPNFYTDVAAFKAAQSGLTLTDFLNTMANTLTA
ncbi:MAG: hypothetical protein IJ506_04335 [Clostridia bacterium]|nr:hypothetical protein [Clostridia bacterium]